MNCSIKLGWNVKELSTGVSGIATQMIEESNGNIKIVVVQPRVKEDGTVIDSFFYDHQLIVKLDDGIADKVTQPPAPCKVKIGDKVRDTISGYTGVVTEIGLHMNGCYRVATTGDKLVKGKLQHEGVSDLRLEVIEPVTRTTNTPKTRTGGPAVRAPSNRVQRSRPS